MVGVSCYILGGGLGPFGRQFGMGSDSLLEAKIVTASGKLLTVSYYHGSYTDEGQLFWALRGAGQGSFCVGGELMVKLHKLKGKQVHAGRLNWEPQQKKTFVETMNKDFATDWPNKMTVDATWVCKPKEETHVHFVSLPPSSFAPRIARCAHFVNE